MVVKLDSKGVGAFGAFLFLSSVEAEVAAFMASPSPSLLGGERASSIRYLQSCLRIGADDGFDGLIAAGMATELPIRDMADADQLTMLEIGSRCARLIGGFAPWGLGDWFVCSGFLAEPADELEVAAAHQRALSSLLDFLAGCPVDVFQQRPRGQWRQGN